VIFGTKCPSIMSTCTQSEPHLSNTDSTASPRAEKSAESMLGAMMAGGGMVLIIYQLEHSIRYFDVCNPLCVMVALTMAVDWCKIGDSSRFIAVRHYPISTRVSPLSNFDSTNFYTIKATDFVIRGINQSGSIRVFQVLVYITKFFFMLSSFTTYSLLYT
jgi:hypothetical protein